MNEEHKNLYEGMFIISSRLSEDARSGALDKVLERITGHDGEVHKLLEMGRRKLAYEINGHREGYFYLVYFSFHPSEIQSMWKDFHLHEDLVRFMTLRTEEVREALEFKSLVEA